MVIASIDMKDGHVVQLKNGKDLVLQRDDAEALISLRRRKLHSMPEW